MNIRIGLYFKFIIIVTAIVIAVAGVLGVFFIRHERQMIYQNHKEQGVVLAENLASEAEYGVLTDNQTSLDELLTDRLRSAEIVYCSVYDNLGKGLAVKWAKEMQFQIPKEIFEEAQLAEKTHVQMFRGTNNTRYYEVCALVQSEGITLYQNEEGLFYADDNAMPGKELRLAVDQKTVIKKTIGRVHIVLSLEKADALLLAAQRTGTIITLIIIVFAGMVTMVLARISTVPILKLAEGTRRLAAGDLTTTVSIKSGDEIGQLAASFNVMTASIKKSRDELIEAKEKIEDWSRTLEQKVDDRTQELSHSQKATLNMMKDLEEVNTYIENIIANFLDTLIVFSTEGKIQRVNVITKQLLGYTESELQGQQISLIADAEILLQKVLAQGVISNYEVEYKRKNGSRIPMLFSGSMMCNKAGVPIGIVGIAKDITERIKAEQALQSYTKQIEEVNKELDDFTYIISHDLKEPLRSIHAFSKFVIDDYQDNLGEEGRDFLARIQANAHRMQALIEDLLEISRIERKKNPFEEIEISQILAEVQLRLEYAIKEKNVEMLIRGRLPKVYCDRIRLTEVFVNLVSNAVKFLDKEKAVVEIGCAKKDPYYEFYVKDNGPGIEEKYFEKVFGIFQRLGRREDTEGTGAGLTIAKKIVEMHKGKIWVESILGEGAAFYFTIPIDKNFIKEKKKIGEILVNKKLVKEKDVFDALKEQTGDDGYEQKNTKD
ncbi:MAG: ATP-binding protein [Candidatus Omnitrophota bacterium]